MKTLIDGFIESKKADGKSKCTLVSYASDLREFESFFNGKKVNDIRYADLRMWANHISANGLSPATRSRKISAVKSFFNYLLKMEIIDKDPTLGLEKPKLEKKEPVVITTDEASEVLFHARNDGGREMLYFRDYTIMAMFLFTGIRREELTNISMEDIDIDNGEILIYGKGAKQRTVYITEELHSVLSEYISYYRKRLEKAKDSKFLFPSIKSEKISVQSVNNIVNRFFKSAGIKKDRISAHILRKRFATSVFENTRDIALTSELLGHSSPTVTMRYVDIRKDNRRKAAMSVSY